MSAILGIDPGLRGGLALLSPGGLLVEPMPTLLAGRGRSLDIPSVRALVIAWRPSHAVLEAQGAMPKQGLVSTFTTGTNYGMLIGLLAGLGIPYTTVRPGVWKRTLGVPAAKDAARARASELFPAHAGSWRLRREDGLAEAALIAEYGRRTLG